MLTPQRPSRILNDSGFLLGLSLTDFVGGVAVFVILASVLNETPYAVLSFIGAIFFCGILIPIRHRHRNKIIRDFFSRRLRTRGGT